MQPLVSVIMPAFNTELYIRQAIESILNQTYKNIEFLIYDDCSTDATVAIIESFADTRIKLIKKQQRNGYTESLIDGIKRAQGKYIARMDSDDISISNRLEKQVNFLEANSDYGIAGSFIQTIHAVKPAEVWKYPVEDSDIKNYTIVNSPFAHPSVVINREVLIQNNLTYSIDYEPCEDYNLWVDLLKVTKGKNLPEVLLYYRLHDSQTIITKRNRLIEKSNIIRQKVLVDFFNFIPGKEQLNTHYYFFNQIANNTAASIINKYQWRKKLLAAIHTDNNRSAIKQLIENYWVINLRTLGEFQFGFLRFLFNRSVVSQMSMTELSRFVFKCIIRYNLI